MRTRATTATSPERRRASAFSAAPAALLLIAALVLLLAGAAPALAVKASPLASPGAGAGDRAIVEFGKDVTVAHGEIVDGVVVVGGDADIAGTVKNAVVVVDGTVTVRATAVIGSEMKPEDGSVVVVAGDLVTEPGARITGKTTDLNFDVPHISLGGLVWSFAIRPVLSAVSWGFTTLFLIIMTLAVVALFPRQVRAVGDRLRDAPLAALGWGALGTFVVIPAVVTVLVLSIVGIVVAVPFVFLLPFVYLFAFAALAALVGKMLFARVGWDAENLVLTAIVGAVLVSLVQLIPLAGVIAIALALVTAFGAACSTFVEWRRRQRTSSPAFAPPVGESAPPPPTSATGVSHDPSLEPERKGESGD